MSWFFRSSSAPAPSPPQSQHASPQPPVYSLPPPAPASYTPPATAYPYPASFLPPAPPPAQYPAYPPWPYGAQYPPPPPPPRYYPPLPAPGAQSAAPPPAYNPAVMYGYPGSPSDPRVEEIEKEIEITKGDTSADPETQELILRMLKEEAEAARTKAEEEEKKFMEFMEKEQQERQKELDSKTYPCLICGDDLPIDKVYILDECCHRFCRDCLEGYFSSKICEGVTRDIRCPSPGCKHLVSYDEVKHVVSGPMFERFERFLLKAALEDDPNCRWCPRPGCGNAMIGNPQNPMMVCSNEKCKFCFCFNCREQWHADVTCEQYQRWKVENNESEQRFMSWASQNTKMCPRCHTRIEKSGGCNHMKCSHCRFEWCWLCNGEYKAGHFLFGPCGGKQYS
eukprot:m51a1_g3332 putative ibr domain containing protein (395) ;mRNA; f:373748-375750